MARVWHITVETTGSPKSACLGISMYVAVLLTEIESLLHKSTDVSFTKEGPALA
jgi:hypothetical protein